MSRKTTVTFVNISDVYHHLGLTDDEITFIVKNAWGGLGLRDAHYTLIGNVFALDCMLEAYEDYHLEVIANKSMTRPVGSLGRTLDKIVVNNYISYDDFTRKFWEVVDSEDFINLEG